jgi:phosphopantothenoylcysteine decarboxylase/phosphopantothenate--cysteine ligase
MLADKHILLVIGGGIAAYKCLDLIRRLRERGATVRVVLTPAAKEFVTPLVVGTLSENQVATELFDLTQEQQIGHINLTRVSDLVVVAPATADLLAKMANGLGPDLATSLLLANDKPVLAVPAMNPKMWAHPATKRNVAQLAADGVRILGPARGKMAERGEEGVGRMVEPMEILAAIDAFLDEIDGPKPLAGRKVLVTAGPTHEPIDPVRYIANRSSGKQGYALATALARAGAEVHLISGPVSLPDPVGVAVTRVVTAREMLAAVEAALPVDVAVMAAAVADWRVDASAEKIKKGPDGAPTLSFQENPDILATLGRHPTLRPKLVVGFAAETQNLIANAEGKLRRKGADVIVANDVSPKTGIMGGDRNTVRIVEPAGVTDWPDLPKDEVAAKLVGLIAAKLGRAD